MGSAKIRYILILQAWAMLWVVIGHALLTPPHPRYAVALFNAAYSFHMPLFMLISGFLFHMTRLSEAASERWNYASTMKDKAVRLLIPMVVFTILAFAVKVAFPGEMNRTTGLSLSDVSQAVLYPFHSPLREMWFIVTLFWLMAMLPLWKSVLRDKRTEYGMLFLLAVLHFIHPRTEFLCIGRVCIYALWFYAGIVMHKENAVGRWIGPHPLAALLAGIALYAAGMYSDEFFCTVGAILFSFALAVVLDRRIPSAFSSFREWTYQIFLIGIFVQILVKIVFRHSSMPYCAGYVLSILAGLYVSVLTAKCIQKLGCKWLLLSIGLKKHS